MPRQDSAQNVHPLEHVIAALLHYRVGPGGGFLYHIPPHIDGNANGVLRDFLTNYDRALRGEYVTDLADIDNRLWLTQSWIKHHAKTR